MTSAVLVLALGLSGQSPQGVYPAAQGPGKVLPAAQAPGKVSPAPQAPAKVSPAPQAPSKVAPAPYAPSKVSPTAQAPSKIAPAPQAPSKIAPAPAAPGKAWPAAQSHGGAAPAAPGKAWPAAQSQVLAPAAPGKASPAAQAPSKVAPAPYAPGKVSPAPQAPGKMAPAPYAPGKVSPAPQAPGKIAPAPYAPGKVAPAAAGSEQDGSGALCPWPRFRLLPRLRPRSHPPRRLRRRWPRQGRELMARTALPRRRPRPQGSIDRLGDPPTRFAAKPSRDRVKYVSPETDRPSGGSLLPETCRRGRFEVLTHSTERATLSADQLGSASAFTSCRYWITCTS